MKRKMKGQLKLLGEEGMIKSSIEAELKENGKLIFRDMYRRVRRRIVQSK